MENIEHILLKAPNDTRDCYTYELQNKLRVYMVQDDNANNASVAMLVKIGYFQDTIPGIAHFLEHMLFNGTKKYPNEKEFMSFIEKYNGCSNAYTTHDHTLYHYSIVEEGLLQSLDIFGHFFVDPLFNKNSVNREKEAVNAEHLKNVNDDGWRCQELLKVASNEKSWFRKFGTGSNETLDIKDIEVHVRKFFEKYYSADKMTLIIVSKNHLFKDEKGINDIFSEITIKPIKNWELIQDIPILHPPKVIKYVPVEDRKHMRLTWEIPYFRNQLERSPNTFLGYLIRNRVKNSIDYILSEKKFALGLSCYFHTKTFSKCLFSIDMELTPLGYKHKKKIISIIIKYVAFLLDKIDELEEIYNDQLKIDAYDYKYTEKSNSMSDVNDMCYLINNYNFDPKYIFVLNYMQDPYPDVKNNLRNVLKEMTLDNLVVMYSVEDTEIIQKTDDYRTKPTASSTFGTEKHKFLEFPNYGTKYVVDDRKIKSVNIKKNASIPRPNPFIPDLENKSFSSLKHPKKLGKDIICYWFPYTKFNIPDIYVFANISMPATIQTVYDKTCMMLYMGTILTEIDHKLYILKSASYYANIFFSGGGKINFRIGGNYKRVNNVCKYILTHITNPDLVTQKSFDMKKYSLTQQYKNFIFNQPHEQLGDIFNKHMYSKYYDTQDVLDVIDKITREDVIKAFNTLFKYDDITLFISGNCSKKIAEKTKTLFQTIIAKTEKPQSVKKLHRTPTKSERYDVINTNEAEKNVAVSHYVYIEDVDFKKMINIKYSCLLRLLDNLISTEYYDTLRTKEMFGYIVGTSIVSTGNNPNYSYYYSFTVQSPDKTVTDIINRNEKFIGEFRNKLRATTDENFEIVKQSILTESKSNFVNLFSLSSYIFNNEIDTGYLQFDSNKVEIKTYQSLTLKDLIEFYEDKFIKNRIDVIVSLAPSL